jgi:DNA-binding NarL/FixJ family response regulator
MSVATLSIRLEPEEWPDALSAAEREVARGLIRGHCYEEIAQRRQASVSTIASQVRSIFGKLGVDSASELVAVLARRAA